MYGITLDIGTPTPSTERKLATIRRITKLTPIESADLIDLATVDGWNVVVQKNEYEVGDLCIYVEIDSWVPKHTAPFLYTGKVYKGVEGARLKTKKIRGVLSQGLILPANQFVYDEQLENGDYAEGDDVTRLLDIIKWEPNIPTHLQGTMKGNFPSFLRKTDQERIQNLTHQYDRWCEKGTFWEVTEKLDGSSMTVYLKDNVFGVCSRNIDLKETEDNAFWKMARELDLEVKLQKCYEYSGDSFAIQSELVGPGIQGNKYKLDKTQFFVFDIFNIKTGLYLRPQDRYSIMEFMDLPYHVPVISKILMLSNSLIFGRCLSILASSPHPLKDADGYSALNKDVLREGLVYKNLNTQESFKAISNEWLLKYE